MQTHTGRPEDFRSTVILCSFSFLCAFVVSLVSADLLGLPALWAALLTGSVVGVCIWPVLHLVLTHGSSTKLSVLETPRNSPPREQSSSHPPGTPSSEHAHESERGPLRPLAHDLDLQDHEAIRILGSIQDCFYSLDRDWRIIYVNQEACRLWGKSKEALLGRVVWDIFPDGTSTESYQRMVQAVRDQQPVRYESFSRYLDRWVEVKLYPIDHALSVYFHDISDRKRAELALRESEERLYHANELLNAVTSSTNVIIAAQDPDFNYTYFNDAYRDEVFRLSGRQIQIGANMAEVFAHLPELQQSAIREWRHSLDGASTNKIVAFSNPNGYHKTYQVYHTPLRDSEGAIVGVGEVAYDVTEQIRTQEALRKSEERYRTLFDSMSEGFAIHELIIDELGHPIDYRFLDVNPAFERLTGIKRDAAVGKTRNELFPDDDPEMLQLLASVVLTGKPVEFERYSPTLMRHYVMSAHCTGPMQFAILFMDITERKRSEDVLRKSAKDYRSLMEEAADGIILTDSSGRPIAANCRITSLVGFSEGALLTMAPDELFQETDRRSYQDFLATIRPSQSARIELGLRKKDGGVVDAEITATRLSAGGVQLIFRDITARKEAEIKARKLITEEVLEKLFLHLKAFRHGDSGAMTLNRLALLAGNLQTTSLCETKEPGADPLVLNPMRKDTVRDLYLRFVSVASEYVGVVAPEIGHIASLATLYEDGSGNQTVAREFRQSAKDLVAHAERLAGELGSVASLVYEDSLDFFQSLSRALPFVLSSIARLQTTFVAIQNMLDAAATCDASAIIEIAEAKLRATARDITVYATSQPGPCKVIMSGAELGKVLDTLLENSLEEFDRRGQSTSAAPNIVSIELERSGNLVRIIVQDNGRGVPEELAGSLFSDGVSGKSSGRGFGLSYVRRLVTKYGGRVVCEPSTSPGARFVVELVAVN